ncbi:serine acetyltransferase [Bacteroides thetaiotaomicron]|uniref:serine acetyltransferase n=1 Tax=Bacteroides thetaiotaomicron TaxID=818 RepID=UPI0034A33AF7|nr:serine acetyltransferase [Bacteroides oleiciplenus]
MIKNKEDLQNYLKEDLKYYKYMPGLKERILKTERYYSIKFVTTLRHYEYALNNESGLWGKLRYFYWMLKFYHIMHETQIYIYPNVCDAGLYIPHVGYMLISAQAIIGKNCVIRPGTLIASNLGSSNQKLRKVTVGDNVEFSAGCKILCRKIGNNVSVGPNAVVSKNVPDNSIVMGNPAEIVPKISF